MLAMIPDLFSAHSQIGYSTAADAMTVGALPLMMGGRLTLTTGTPITTADVTAAGTLYWTPHGPAGGFVTLYDGSKWHPMLLSELSIAGSAGYTTGNKMYDVFIDYNGGTPALATLAWTDDTTRATALTYQDGRYCLTGSLDWNYVGSIRTLTAEETEDSYANRLVWNMYNRTPRELRLTDTGSAFTLAAGTAQWRASTDWQVGVVQGIAADVMVSLSCFASTATSGGNAKNGIDIDSATDITTGGQCVSRTNAVTASNEESLSRAQTFPLTAGYHYLAVVNDAFTYTATYTMPLDDILLNGYVLG